VPPAATICSSSTDDLLLTDTDLTRRDLLERGAAGAAFLGAGGPGFLAARRRRRPLYGGTFPLGVASGVPLADGATLWTRVDGLERTGRVELEVAADPQFYRVLHRERPLVLRVRDFTVKRTVRSKRLRPGETYWYRFESRDGSSQVGRFRTALPADSAEPVRIGFFSCQKWHQGYYTAHRGLAAEPDIDLVVSLGDYIYEEPVQDVTVTERRDTTGQNKDGDVQTLREYRAKYRLYKSDPDLLAMHLAHPVCAIWDDHEAEDDYAGTTEGDALRPRRVPFAERRRAGYLSFFEYQPIPRLRSDPFRTYGSLRLGGLELLLLDTRQYRDPLACRPLTPCLPANAPGRSILGGTQRAWLMSALAASSANWKVIANQVMMMSLDLATLGVGINADQWDGYAAERRELMEHVLARGIKDVTVITGDIHTFFAGTVHTSGRIESPAAATEFVGGAITAAGIQETLGGGDATATETTIRASNPHLAYVDARRKGYGVLEATPGELKVTFRSPRTVLAPRSEIDDIARFRVARGSTVVERL
jgi:alkaline phosphatase D